jgi:hypothetical protein
MIAGLFILVLGTNTNNNLLAKEYMTQTVEQVNDCGNYKLPNSVTCSNFNLNSERISINNNMTLVHQSFLPFP